MRTAYFRKAPRGRQVSQSYSLPAPVGGWNARDSYFGMDELDATVLKNWFPETNDIRVRKGWEDHVTGMGPVNTLMTYTAPTGTDTLFAVASNSIYDVTSAGAVGAAVVSGLSSNYINYVNFTNSSGTSYLCCFNGADSPRYYNGSSWATITDVSSPGIVGITTSTIVTAAVHKRRMWLVVNNSLRAYYLPVDSVGGDVSNNEWIDLGGIAYKGGYISAIGTWTIDAGEGADDYWVAVTSEGQVVVYVGTDPTSSSTWNLQGVWDIGPPIGRKCLIKYQGDLLILTIHGIIPLSKLVMSAQTDPSIAITNKIEKAMTTAAQDYKTNPGWEMIVYPQADMFILNVPIANGALQEQYVMNTITGAWARFSGIEANCWAIMEQDIYFGDSTGVRKFWSSLSDDGSNIETDLRQAENYFGSPGAIKYWKSIRPIFRADGIPSVGVSINPDYSDEVVIDTISYSGNDYALWDSGVWDTGIWSGGLDVTAEWLTASDVGISGGLRIKTLSKNMEVRFQSSDHLFESGGVIG